MESQDRPPLADTLRFGPFEVDVHSGELRKHGRRLRLQEQPFLILLMLLERPGEVVPREDIRQRLWPDGTSVEFDQGINSAVKRLRTILAESADKPRYIETLARRGYRFIALVEPLRSKSRDLPSDEPSAAAAHELQHPAPGASPSRFARPRTLLALLLAAAALAGLAGVLFHRRGAAARWAREVAQPEAARFVKTGNYPAAFPLLFEALQILPSDPELNKMRREISFPVPIVTTPPSANVYIKPYALPDSPWLLIGQSPLQRFLLPTGYFRWRITRQGSRTVEAAAGLQLASIEFHLDPENAVPEEMVHVPRGTARSFALEPTVLDDFFIDKYEVTNRQFKEFVDQGGYRDRRYWRNSFVKDGHALTWEEAMSNFHDATGRPGPSSWEVGDYPAEHGDFPVSGVSWYEASAYAEFRKKQLPTIYHWYRAAGQGIYSDVLMFSNFLGSGPWRVGSHAGLGAFGTYDMAGNVKEWCSNETGNRRYILGGGWKEGRSNYASPDALSPFDRSASNGFRCVRYGPDPVPASLTAPVEKAGRDYRTERPVSDTEFAMIERFYSYDRTDLNAKKEALAERSPYWTAENITFDAAYGRERVTARLYLPANVKPPYQTIVYFPAGHARIMGSIDDTEVNAFEFLVKSGRAVLLPVYQGTFERRGAVPQGPSGERDLMVHQVKDFRRAVDYLDTRADILHDRLGFFGVSLGSQTGLLILAQEPRIRVAVEAEGGLSGLRKPPEIDGINFAPRVRIPLLMLNGRYDFIFPEETAQRPLFRLLGTPANEKRAVSFEKGHVAPALDYNYIKETLDWFDRWLGPPVSK